MAKADLTWYDRTFFGTTMSTFLNGGYVTLDARYFFHEDPDKIQRRRAQKAKKTK
jgi:hypothetical protein